MAHGSFTATSASTAIVAADANRDKLLIQKLNTTAIDLGFGIAAEAGKGVHMVNASDSVVVKGPLAAHAVYAIGNGGTGTWQDGNVEFQPAGPA